MSDMEHKESYDLFRQSMRKAADCAHKLAKEQQNKAWLAVAQQFEIMLHNGEKLYNQPGVTHQEAVRMADELIERHNRARGH